MDPKSTNTTPPTPPTPAQPTIQGQQMMPPGAPQQAPPPAQNAATDAPAPPMQIPKPPTANKKLLGMMMIALIALLAVVGGIFFFVLGRSNEAEVAESDSEFQISSSDSLEDQAEGLQIDEVDGQIKEIEQELENL